MAAPFQHSPSTTRKLKAAYIDSKVDVPVETKQDMIRIREAVSRCAHTLEVIFDRRKPNEIDVGRSVEVMTILKSVQRNACDALKLPRVKIEEFNRQAETFTSPDSPPTDEQTMAVLE